MKANKKLIKQYKTQPKLVSPKELDKMKEKATENATNQALNVIVVFSLMALRDEFGFGKERLLKFHAKFFDLADSYNRGYITAKDLWDTLEEEVKVNFNA